VLAFREKHSPNYLAHPFKTFYTRKYNKERNLNSTAPSSEKCGLILVVTDAHPYMWVEPLHLQFKKLVFG